MALEETVRIIFEGDDRVGNTITGISSGIDSLASSAVTATEPLANIAESALQLEAALAALAVGGFALAINAASEFESSFNEIATLISASDENLIQFNEDILTYARTSTASIDDINAAVYTAISAGTDYNNSLALLRTSERLATAGKADLEATTRLLASTMNSYGAATEEAGQYSDAFFQTVRLGQTTLPELADSIAQVTPLAAQLGVPIETLTASIAALTAGGTPTAQAITQIRSALVALGAPATQAAALAEELGVDIGAAAIQSQGFETVLRNVFDATGGNVEQLRLLLGRVEALSAVLVLGEDETGRFASALEDMRNASGSTADAFAIMAENLNQVSQTLRNNLRATLIDFGQPLLDESVDVMQAISNVFQSVSFSFQQGAFDPVFELVQRFGTNLAANLEQIADVLPEALENIDWSGLIESIESLGDSVVGLFDAFFDDVDLTTPEGLAAAIQLVVNSAESLTRVVAGILRGWEPFIDAIRVAIDEFNESGESIQEMVGQFLGWSQAVNTIANNIGILTGALNLIGGALSLLAITSIPRFIVQLRLIGTTIATVGLGVSQFLAVLAAPFAGWAAGTWLRENIPIVREFGDRLGELAFDIINFGDDSVEAAERQAEYTQELGRTQAAMVLLAQAIGNVPEEQTTRVLVEGTREYEQEFNSIYEQVQNFPEEKQTEVTVQANEPSIARAVEYITVHLPDGKTMQVAVNVDQPSLQQAAEDVAQIPPEKELEIRITSETQIELARIEAQADIVQSSLEWTARVDIAEVEAAAEIMTALSGDVSAMFENTGDVLGDLFSQIGDLDTSRYLDLQRYIDAESERRDELLRIERELATAQTNYFNARTAAITGGQGLVTIRGENLEPELQLVLNRIIELTQVTANEQGLEFLIGV